MPVWASYSLNDLLLFSPDTYFRLYALINTQHWPLHLLVLVIGLALLALTRSATPLAARLIPLLLALLSGITAWVFFHQQYSQINTAAPWFAIGFMLQAMLLLLLTIKGMKGLVWLDHRNASFGLSILLYAFFLHPLIGPLSGRPWNSVEFIGLAPDPTALATLGILLMGSLKKYSWLTLIPLLWCLITGLTYLAMGIGYGLATPLVAIFGVAATIWQRKSYQNNNISQNP